MQESNVSQILHVPDGMIRASQMNSPLILTNLLGQYHRQQPALKNSGSERVNIFPKATEPVKW